MTSTTMTSDLAREALEPCTIHSYAQEYEFRYDDGGGYTPTDAERAMIEDAINGFLSETAHPVDEPGELERLNDLVLKLSTDIDSFWKPQFDEQVTRAETAEASLAESEQNAQGLASDLAGTQAELAETRERLEKPAKRVVALLQDLASQRRAVPRDFTLHQKLGGACADLLAALSTQESSAALSGDGKEVGR